MLRRRVLCLSAIKCLKTYLLDIVNWWWALLTWTIMYCKLCVQKLYSYIHFTFINLAETFIKRNTTNDHKEAINTRSDNKCG